MFVRIVLIYDRANKRAIEFDKVTNIKNDGMEDNSGAEGSLRPLRLTVKLDHMYFWIGDVIVKWIKCKQEQQQLKISGSDH